MSDTPPTSDTERDAERAALAHALPFVAWGLGMLVTAAPAEAYAARAAACAGLLAFLRPWRGYARLRPRDAVIGTLAGAAVFVLWVLPETAWAAAQWPAAHDFYLRGLARSPLAADTPAAALSPFAPAACGWPLALARLAGSALVIAPIEEFFWRGFLYRLLISRAFTGVSLVRFAPLPFLAVVAMFGLEHDRWLAGMLAGAIYGALVIRTGRLGPAVIAHVVTNALLGGYVLARGDFRFW